MEVRLFGELEVVAGGVPVPVRGAKQRALLALLALRRGAVGQRWPAGRRAVGDGQAANPANALQAQIGRLRRTLGAAAILTTEAGYALAAGPDEVDVVRFERLVAKGGRLAAGGELAAASAVLGEALGLRRGEPLAEFAYAGFCDAERAQLGELTLVAIESRAGADLGLGRHGELAGELEALCREHPLRERLYELLILALYRSGRQAGALRAYTEIRDRLAGELGIDPGPALRELQARILAQCPVAHPGRRPGRPGSAPETPDGSGGRRAGGGWAAGRSAGAGPAAGDEVLCPGGRGVAWCRVRG
jgi:DNA-binding SARP family transcriptional activator